MTVLASPTYRRSMDTALQAADQAIAEFRQTVEALLKAHDTNRDVQSNTTEPPIARRA